ncbi:unnamed protein product [Darwinula stevensoni]|uniref:G-protein coupled receptors family 1 profile domain-containing protein n=1 Tax=Darwinula stevensoni TaxID=69355 RepID=A0A7R8XAZ8_9CRUS|nr:unnamed protein product [Darwinula stevensoni]CAG0887220.1 unnamed protein product [Darwinula stevensoni]
MGPRGRRMMNEKGGIRVNMVESECNDVEVPWSMELMSSTSWPEQEPMGQNYSNISGEEGGGVSGANTSHIYTTVETVMIALVAGAMSILTVGGNVMVMVSFKIDKQLQTISNYFLFSLAVADFAVGLISMPLFTVYLLVGRWPFGPIICDTWLALDYLASNASVLNLLIISFDRYFSVTRPLTYRARRTTKRAAVMIASAWLISLVLWPPWIYSWPYIEGKRTVPEGQCYIQFLETNMYITVGTAIAAFYFPVSVMIALYYKIWRETKKRQKEFSQLQADQRDSSRRSNSSDEAVGGGGGGGGEVGDPEDWKRARSESSNPDEIDSVILPTSLSIDPKRLAKVKSPRDELRQT